MSGIFSSILCVVAYVLVSSSQDELERAPTDRNTRQSDVALSLTYGERMCWGT